MLLVYFCKNSWWDARKARKVLLPLAFAGLEGCRTILVNAARPAWSGCPHPSVWTHPSAAMTVLSPRRWLPGQRLAPIRYANQWVKWASVMDHVNRGAKAVVVLSDPEDHFVAGFAHRAGLPCWFDWTERWDLYMQSAPAEAQMRIDPQYILHQVDGIIAVSRELEDMASRMGKPVFYLPNAVSDSWLAYLDGHTVPTLPSQFAHIPRPRVVHIGSYNPVWIDWSMLIAAAQRSPHASFCMIGGGNETAVPSTLPENIHLLGRMAYEDLPAVLAHADVCLLLYRPQATSANDPTKLYEYLASGLPIVSTPHPRAIEFGKWIFLSGTAQEYAEAVFQALQEHDAKQAAARRRLAAAHAWTKRAETLRDRMFT